MYFYRGFLLGALLLSAVSWADCAQNTSHFLNGLQLGVHLESLVANQLPDFNLGLPLYGVSVGAPIWNELVVGEAVHGNVEDLSLFRFEIALRHIFYTPYFIPFVQMGGIHLKYSRPGGSHAYFGPAFAVGVSLPMDETFTLHFLSKYSYPTRALFSIGGGFTVLL